MFARRLAPAVMLVTLLAGCEMLGIESPERVAATKEGEGKAVGSACRHANRALEDCYALNPKAQKAAVFAGWREMDEYMREHKIDGVAPTLARNAARPEAAVRPGATGPERKPPVAADATKPAPTHES
ncbi:MAG: hypothetical protein IPG91_20015 [Ideonella sp.]|nr:hypothetical protein [Ideonella sp.]